MEFGILFVCILNNLGSTWHYRFQIFANFKQNRARSTNSFWGTEMQNPFRQETEIAIRASGMHHEAILSWRFELAENWETPSIRYQNVTNRINTLFESFRSLKWHDQVCLDKFLQDFLPFCSFLKINTFGTLYDQTYPNVLSCKQTTNGFNIPQSQGKLRSGSLGQNWMNHFKNWTSWRRREDVVKTSWICEVTRHHQNVWLHQGSIRRSTSSSL